MVAVMTVMVMVTNGDDYLCIGLRNERPQRADRAKGKQNNFPTSHDESPCFTWCDAGIKIGVVFSVSTPHLTTPACSTGQ